MKVFDNQSTQKDHPLGGLQLCFRLVMKCWSGRPDLNRGPLHPMQYSGGADFSPNFSYETGLSTTVLRIYAGNRFFQCRQRLFG